MIKHASSMAVIHHPAMPPRFKVRSQISAHDGRRIWTWDSLTGHSGSGGHGDGDPFAHAVQRAHEESTARRAIWYREMQQRGKTPTGDRS